MEFFKKHPKFTTVLSIEFACALAYSISYIEPDNLLINSMKETQLDFADLGKVDLDAACMNIGILICILSALILASAFAWDRHNLNAEPQSIVNIDSLYNDESITRNEYF